MKKELLIIGIVSFVVLTLFFVFDPLKKEDISGNVVKETNKFETQYSESTVIVDLTPKEIKNGVLHIEIGVNTHTVDLSKYNLQELITLEYNNKIIKPESAPKLQGHHNYGDLFFKVDNVNIESFIIKVRDLPDIQERVFEW